jgi:biopolymer transport protein ExbB/TolQ
MGNIHTNSQYALNWKRLDPEAKWGFRAKKFTAVSNGVSLLLGLGLTIIFYAVMYPLHLLNKWQMVNMFFHGGPENRSTIPYYTVLLSCWCLAFLIIKAKKLAVQKLALDIRLIPEDATADFVISPMNAQEILSELSRQVLRVEDFMLLWRIECALGNLKNIGRVSDVSSLLSDLGEQDANYVESSYTLPKGLIWAIPVLGFIGTVLGLSQAVGGFGAVVAGGADLDALKGALGGVTGGLATAFETTLIALVAALIIQLLLTFLQQKEDAFLDDCASYCHDQLTSRLKMVDIRDDVEKF